MVLRVEWEHSGCGNREKEPAMNEKSRPQHQAKKPGKTLKQKRAEKRAVHEDSHPSIIPPTHAQH